MPKVTFHLKVGGGYAMDLPAGEDQRIAGIVRGALTDPAQQDNTITLNPDAGDSVTVRIGDIASVEVA